MSYVWHTNNKSYFLTGGKFVDAIKRRENAVNEAMESKLKEGEDLHTFCKNIYHYGIAWSPIDMEQRTGRIDRIGSLASRLIRDDNEIVLNMDDYNFKNRIEILEEIGQTVTSKVLDYIENANKELREKLTIELELNDSDKKKFKTEKLTSILETGSDFFIIS